MITKEQALQCLEDTDDHARMASVESISLYSTLKEYIEQTDKKLQDIKNKVQKNISILVITGQRQI